MLSYRREIRLGLETWRLVLSLGLRAKVRGHTTENQLCNAPVPRDGAAPHVSRRKTAVRRLRRERAVGGVSGQKSDDLRPKSTKEMEP